MPCEPEHDFVLLLAGVTELTPELQNALFEAGCDDATLSERSGRIFLTFTRSAQTLKEAILSAIRDIGRANVGARVLRVDDCSLVTQADIARKIGRTRSLINQYISGARGPGRFPAPVRGLADDTPVWQWWEVADWLQQNDMIGEKAVREAQDTAMINLVLEVTHQEQLNPEFFRELYTALSEYHKPASSAASGQPVQAF
jgi:hypothetical protein